MNETHTLRNDNPCQERIEDTFNQLVDLNQLLFRNINWYVAENVKQWSFCPLVDYLSPILMELEVSSFPIVTVIVPLILW